jgi:hypothetical protein
MGLPDHGLPLVQLKEQRRDLVVALQNRKRSGLELGIDADRGDPAGDLGVRGTSSPISMPKWKWKPRPEPIALTSGPRQGLFLGALLAHSG